MAKQKDKIEFRYYEIPEKEQILALLGDSWKRGYGLDYLHFHNYMEIGVCHYGEGEVVIDDKHYPYHDTAVTIIPPNVPHDARTVDDKAYWEWMYIDVESVLRGMYPNDEILAKKIRNEVYHNALFCEQSEQPMLMHILNAIMQEAVEKKYMYRESINGFLRSFIVELLRINKCQESQKRIEQNMFMIASAIDHVEKHYREEIKISEMAEACSISESHFRKLFSACMGISPLDYLNLIRIQKASELMVRSNSSIESISYEVGYKTMSTFIRNFRKFLGETPYQWKKSADNHEGKVLNFKINAQKGWFYK